MTFDAQNSPNSRRSFLKIGAAAAAGLSLAGSLPAFADDAAAKAGADGKAATVNDEYGGLPIGLQSYTLRSMSLENALKAMGEELKVHRVEVFPGHTAGLSPQQIKDLSKSTGVKLVAYGVVPFGTNHDANRAMFEIAKEYGMSVLTCDPENDPKCWESLGELCEEYNVAAAIHPHGPGSRWVKIDQIWEAVKDQHKLIGLCDETGWFIAADEDPVRALEVFKDRCYGMHLKDFKKTADGKLEDVPAGQGVLDVDALIKKLLEIKPDARFAMSIEYEGGEPVEQVKKSLMRVKEAVKKARA
jgi:sugar phosphate isomerase/epimerase